MDLTPREQQELAEAQRDPRRQLGPYLLLKELGRGGMGVVFKGFDPRVGRRVAIKLLLDPSAHRLLARFQQEAQLASRLQHPSVAQVFELSTADPNAPFLVLQYVPGRSLLDRIRAAPGGLTRDTIARWVAEAAEGIAAAHAAGVLHRDLKPANIMITPDDRAVVLDFGLAKAESDPHGLTQTGELVGTVNYMAPELATGEHQVTTSVDVYGLGGVLYECLTGQAPYVGASQVNVLSSLIHRPVHPPSKVAEGVDPELEAICLRCLDRDPAARFADATAVAEALRDLLDPSASRPSAAGSAQSSAPLVLLSAGVLVLVAGLGLLAFSRTTSPAPGVASGSPTTALPSPTQPPSPTPAPTTSSPPPRPSTGAEEARRAHAALLTALRWTAQPLTRGKAEHALRRRGRAGVKAALERLKGIVAAHPTETEARALLADGHYQAFELEEAIRIAGELLASDPRSRSASRTFFLAGIERFSLLFRAEAGVPESTLTQNNLDARALTSRIKEQAAEDDPILRACVLVQEQKGSEAYRVLKAAGTANLEALYWKALITARGKPSPDLNKVVKHSLNAVLERDPRNPRAAFFLCLMSLRWRRPKAARRALGRVGVTAKTAFLLARLATWESDPARALELAERAQRLAPQNPIVHWARGYVLRRRDPQDALRSAERALALDPHHYNTLTLRGSLLHARGDYAEAVASFRAAIERRDDQPLIQINLASSLGRVGKRDEALRVLRAVDPRTNTNLLQARANELHVLGDFPGAIADLTEAVRLIKSRPVGKWTARSLKQVHSKRAAAHYGAGDLERARADLARVFEGGVEGVHKAYLIRGQLRRKEQKHAQAAADFREYLRRAPEDARTRSSLEAYLKRYP